ncbi:hypothetical protein Plhal304r1_c020g0072681 [Plasmopara halstedii]
MIYQADWYLWQLICDCEKIKSFIRILNGLNYVPNTISITFSRPGFQNTLTSRTLYS